MNTETKACPMCGETILAVAKKCKHCQEYLEISDESSKSNEFSKYNVRNIYSKVKSNVSRLANTNYESGDKNVYSTKKITKDIDGEIKSYKGLSEYDANYDEIYKIIKECGNINLNDIISKLSKGYLCIEQEDIEKILDDLIDLGLIRKHYFRKKILYSAKTTSEINQKHKFETNPFEKISSTNQNQGKLQESSTGKFDINELSKSNTQEVNGEHSHVSRHVFDSKFNKENNRVYSFIKKYGTVRLAHIKKSLSIDNLEIEKIVNNLVANGDICKNNINDEVCCSVNKINQENLRTV